ncbi:MAG: hypothetical protein A2Y73_04165 [Chloroflexi bacterium RBG_13_56_8]|nr:MAG: hypothetical protein A2Y73_04165 [Chloroflexi bacterium RBG_13_56_8]
MNSILQERSPIKGKNSFRLHLPENSCIEDVVRELALPREEVGIAAINRKHAELSQRLHEGDEVILFPRLPIGG